MITMLFLPMLFVLPLDPVGVWEAKTFLHKDAVDVVEGAVEKDFGLGRYKDFWIHDGTIVIERLRRTNRCFAVSWYRAGLVNHTTIIWAGAGTYQGKLTYQGRLPLSMLPPGNERFSWELKWDFRNRCYVFRLGNPGHGSQTWRMRQIAKIRD